MPTKSQNISLFMCGCSKIFVCEKTIESPFMSFLVKNLHSLPVPETLYRHGMQGECSFHWKFLVKTFLTHYDGSVRGSPEVLHGLAEGAAC